nr:unnamed protein product [Callosobruchus analis]
MDKRLNLRSIEVIRNSKFNVENVPTTSSDDQLKVEELVLRKYEDFYIKLKLNVHLPELLKEQHKKYLYETLFYLPSIYECLDASRPWLCYWILHPLSLFGVRLDERRKSAIAKFLNK